MVTTFIAGIGDSNCPTTWSGTPFHLLEAGRAAGIFDVGLDLSVERKTWTVRRALWNLSTCLRGRRYGGYQYSTSFLERLYAPVHERLRGNRIVNWFQLYPPSIVENPSIDKWFYIDMTLRQLFERFGVCPAMDRRTIRCALERELEGYHSATAILTLSQWAARSVVEEYGISPSRVHAIIPGANISQPVYSRWADSSLYRDFKPGRPLKLVFAGKYWQRKGLDRLLEAFRIARASGADLSLRVIGVDRNTIPHGYRNLEAVEWLGFIDKRTNSEAFVKAIAECDVGCLLSRADASPIAVREFAALGLITVCTDVGGASEMTVPDASVLVPLDASDETVSAILVNLYKDREGTERMLRRSSDLRRDALWESTVCKLQKHLQR